MTDATKIAGLASFCLALGLCPPSAQAAETPAPSYWSVRRDAYAAYLQKDYTVCAAAYAKAAGLTRWEDGEDLYSSACCKALGGDKEGAFATLRKALDLGYTDADAIATDSDLASLHADPGWTRLVAGFKARRDSARKSMNVELEALFEQDQKERRETPRKEWVKRWPAIQAHDQERRRKADRILGSTKKLVAQDYYHAAMLFQHGETMEDIEKAERLAMAAVELDPRHGPARWLVAATRDRKLMRLGRPQLYGTQFAPGDDGKPVRYAVDPNVTDEERAEWNVPPLDDPSGMPR